MNRLLLTFFCLLSVVTSFCQGYSYTHYDINEGLAGSTVYCITQDKEGFIWTGTETGVSRFDGTHFKNFTTTDGLPDIEVLQIYDDSKDRIWMAPFRPSVCYYYKGKIYNQDNDSLLHHIHLRHNIETISEDDRGYILLQERTALHLVTPYGKVHTYDSIGGRPIRACTCAGKSPTGHFRVQEGPEIFEFSENGFVPVFPIIFPEVNPTFIAMSPHWMIYKELPGHCIIRSLETGKISRYPNDTTWMISYSILADNMIYFNETIGTTGLNPRTGALEHFLPGKQVSRTFRDDTGNLWFTTLGQGIYRLNTDAFRNVELRLRHELSSIFSIKKVDSQLWVGDNHNGVLKLSLPDLTLQSMGAIQFHYNKNRILYLDKIGKDTLVAASDYGILRSRTNFNLFSHIFNGFPCGVKSVSRIDRNELLLSTSVGAGIFDLRSFQITDTLWRDRTTACFYSSDTFYIGTLNGLYAIAKNKSVSYLGKDIPFLRKRISSMAQSPDGTIWISSYDDAGVIGYRNGRVVATITRRQGLTSDVCRNLYIHNNILWIGTDKGLNKVDLAHLGSSVIQYTSDDGLGSNIINTVFADSDEVYAGTPAGLSFFVKANAGIRESCRLYLLSFLHAGRERVGDTTAADFPYDETHLRFEFAAISYRSAANLFYRYRMLGLDSNWQDTKESFLEYPTLPPGHYQLQLQAINKFGIRSALVSRSFSVKSPFWQVPWFWAFVVAIVGSLAAFLVNRRFRRIRRQQEEKDQLTKRMTEMEHKAISAQMNPHFLFNCLNSVQQYIFEQDIVAANKYITGFARLVRATMLHSTKSFIPLSDEIEYLRTYLSLEKMRFKEKMDYLIEVLPPIEPADLLIPPMLIQPYVENSMRHGLRHKTDGKGLIRLQFQQHGSKLVIIIEDNGIGRILAASYKTREHIEYQSKGMSLTADRIRLINTNYNSDIRVEVSDLIGEDGQGTGTRVMVEFTLFE